MQNGADAAALALAQECAARGPKCTQSMDADSLPSLLTVANKTDSNAQLHSLEVDTQNHLVTVVTKSDRGSVFATIWGYESTTVLASASAIWGGIEGARVLPLTVSQCFLERLPPIDPDTPEPPTVKIPLKELKNNKDGLESENCGLDPHYIPGGFGWLDIDTDCRSTTNLGPDGAIYGGSNSGNNGPNGPNSQNCDAVLKHLEDTTVLIPVFDRSIGVGTNGTFKIIGYAEIYVTSYCFNPNTWQSVGTQCGGERFIEGYFVRMVALDADLGDGGADYGVKTVRLILPKAA